MIALCIEFVAGQFHASPWNGASKHGVTEWPPSPWRLLCAIVAGWHHNGAEDRQTLVRVLDALAECPVFDLPLVSSGHTRHYVSNGVQTAIEIEGALMLDSFIALEPEREHRAQAFVIWPTVTLTADQYRLLETCCAAIRDLGASESPCSVTAMIELPSVGGRFRVDLASRDTGDGPTVRRLAADASRRGIGLLRSLNEGTCDMKRPGRAIPAGSGWVEYHMPLDFGWVAEQAVQRDIRRAVMAQTVLRFAIEPEKKGALPSITDAVTVAEKVRQAVLKRHSDMNGTPASKRLAGKQLDGSERREGHDHPFFLPLDQLNRGLIDAVDIWLPQGCTQDEFLALSGITRIWDPVILQGAFRLRYVGQVERQAGREWRTATPVILDRFPKRRGPGGSVFIDAPEEQLRRALAKRGLLPISVEIWNPRETIPRRRGGVIRVDAFRRARTGAGTRHPAVGATLCFDQTANGPIVLGRLAHFGLGRFEAVPECEDSPKP